MFEKFAEILFVDSMYKLIDLRISMHWLLTVDGDGLNEIVTLFILGDERQS